MTGGTKAIKTLIIVAAAISCLAVPAYSQGFSKMRGASGPPVETHPKVDENAYKAALDRIPTPSQKYDPWGTARSSEAGKTGKESGQGRP
ncbi:hypothetical protein [Bradyrhizobium canariense]|uniref:Uncharacterized protein n=1 Tax=Bradyrhizobium canariense TaxID=255045 RepID=A0A1H1QUB3_9BRAD|nr:hypothetical protein [Bradyrhizobium canariense]SDS26449.1 hypothetical protein SAMN05444158_1520 [Bradyrhizobium canariense]